MKQCSECGTSDEELRAYGADGALICFDCAFKSPENKKRTEEAFEKRFEDGPVIVAAEPPPSKAN